MPLVETANSQQPRSCGHGQGFENRSLSCAVVADDQIELRRKLELRLLKAAEARQSQSINAHDEVRLP